MSRWTEPAERTQGEHVSRADQPDLRFPRATPLPSRQGADRRQCALRWIQALITWRGQDPVVLPAAALQVLQLVPLSWNAAGGTLLPVLLPVKPMVTDA